MNIILKHVAGAALALCATQLMAQQVVQIGHADPVSDAIVHLGKDNKNGALTLYTDKVGKRDHIAVVR
ncbi:MAG: hypothetical protein KAY21_05515 [Limnohabitans sp.]|nr:hypothetical protein [Limnohabitans sp.]